MKKKSVFLIVFFGVLLSSSMCFASWFDGVPRDAISFLNSKVRGLGDFDAESGSRRFGDVVINYNFDAHFDSYMVQIKDLQTGQVIAQYTSNTWKSFTKSEILSALGSATALEDLDTAVTTPTTTTTSTSTSETPFTTGDADEEKAPLVSSETPVATADRTTIRIVENIIVPKAVTKQEKERAAQLAAEGKARMIGGTVSYEDFDFYEIDGNSYEIVAGAEKDYDNYTLGVLVPLQYVDITGGDWTKLAATGFIKKNFSKESFDSSLGWNLTLEQTWMDVTGVDDNYAYGTGPMGSLTFYLQSIEIGFGANLLFMGNSEYDSVTLLTTALNLGIPIGQNFVLNAYTYRNDNFDSDNDYWVIGGTGSIMISDAFELNAGVNGVTGHDNYDSTTVYLGGAWRY